MRFLALVPVNPILVKFKQWAVSCRVTGTVSDPKSQSLAQFGGSGRIRSVIVLYYLVCAGGVRLDKNGDANSKRRITQGWSLI